MRVLSINQSLGKPIQMARRVAKTGIFKEPVQGPVQVGDLGLSGDAQINQKYHGGPDQALYVYSAADLDWWSGQLGRLVAAGSMGENLTLSHFGAVSVGDRLSFGSTDTGLLLEVSAPRVPCATLAAAFGLPDFAKRFAAAGRVGFYARVLRGGQLETGASVSWESREGVALMEVFELMMDKKCSLDRVRAALKWPLAQRYRKALEERLSA